MESLAALEQQAQPAVEHQHFNRTLISVWARAPVRGKRCLLWSLWFRLVRVRRRAHVRVMRRNQAPFKRLPCAWTPMHPVGTDEALKTPTKRRMAEITRKGSARTEDDPMCSSGRDQASQFTGQVGKPRRSSSDGGFFRVAAAAKSHKRSD